jgi:hypothetical protein
MPTASESVLSSIKSKVAGSLSWQAARNTNLYLDAAIVAKGASIMAYKQKIPVERDSVLVFADDAPRYNWAHPCRYLLHDARSGEFYREVRAQFPPYLMSDPPKTYQGFHLPVKHLEGQLIYPIIPRLRCPIRFPKGQRYAVLYSGASNNRHTNDLEFLYRTLRDIYGFPAANIYVLNYDGAINYSGGPKPVSSWPGDSTAYRMPVNGKGTKADLDTVFTTLKGKLKPDDLLLIHTNNHGGHNGTESYLCTYSGSDYLASDFANTLGTLPKINCLMVMMEQCHSGGFNSPILAHSTATYTSVSSACEELRNSIGGADFDPFARDWIAAMTGHTPYGGALASNPDIDGSGKVSAREAHNYADSVHDPYDTPVYSESSLAAGNCYLGQRYVYLWPIYCRLLVEILEPYYIRRPIPEFYAIMHEKLLPSLAAIEEKLITASTAQEAELRKALSTNIKRIMG